MSQPSDYPLSAVPVDQRKGMWSMMSVLLGFTFFTSTMWAGGTIGSAFSFYELLGVIFIGNLLLGSYAAGLAYIACKTGLNTVLLGRYCFGLNGSKLSDFILGFTQIGWYAWGTATIAIIIVKLLELPETWLTPLMIFFGFGFCISASIGYKALELLSKISVPVMLFFIGLSFYKGIIDVGGIAEFVAINPTESMPIAAAITMVFGTFVSGGTQATNWSRFAKTGKIAVISTLAAFFVGNGLMVFVGAFGASIYQQADIVDVLVSQGFMLIAILMLFSNIWTTQDNTIYNFAAAGCNLLRTDKRRIVTFFGAALGTALAVMGMYNMLIPFLILLGTFIPPIGAIIMADFWVKYKGNMPSLDTVKLPKYNMTGLSAYVIGSGCAYFSPWVAPLVGIVVSVVAYTVLLRFTSETKLQAQGA
ncbi:cytosine permease [Marinomonas foliarum]|uniref:Cytosine permease n=1 Tax=Marinomonas foliarum TaxID=491950 RepID=A0ABX7IQ27_9GAMM|nr:cytosine permease [Marinomonas foliarum]QRV23384.1 cytosine permease [Marinomonas foliarum]|tara:strand:- start:15414 stop:16670 length:1257 start_codon:yes stop_codon:yes gene_type:complete